MTFEEYLSNMKPGYTVDGGSEDHLIMHEMSQRALKITMELNNKYHTKEEIVQLALPYEILLSMPLLYHAYVYLEFPSHHWEESWRKKTCRR